MKAQFKRWASCFILAIAASPLCASFINFETARFFQRDGGAVWTNVGILIFGGGTERKEFDSAYLWSPSPGLTLNMGTL
jgi:hypothetical protein